MTLYWKMKLWREEQKTHNPIWAVQLWKEEQKAQDPIWAMKMLREKQKPMTLYETMKLWREEQETQKAVKGRTETHVPLKEKESHGPIIKWIARRNSQKYISLYKNVREEQETHIPIWKCKG